MLQAQIYIDKDEQKEQKPLHQHIMQLLVDNGILGATALVGNFGFGKHHRLKTSSIYNFNTLPVLITFVDENRKVKEVITQIRKIYRGGLILTHEVEQW